jgi:hypothetical protein
MAKELVLFSWTMFIVLERKRGYSTACTMDGRSTTVFIMKMLVLSAQLSSYASQTV